MDTQITPNSSTSGTSIAGCTFPKCGCAIPATCSPGAYVATAEHEKALTLKPFDLQAAMNGKPIQTRNGRPAKFIAMVHVAEKFPFVALVDKQVLSFTDSGFFQINVESGHDLFMASVKKTIWLNIFKDGDGNFFLGAKHSTEAFANTAASQYMQENFVKTISVEVDE